MSKFLTFLSGKKTYITAIAIAILGVAEGYGFIKVPEWVWAVLASLGLTFIRSGVNGVASVIKPIANPSKVEENPPK